MRLSLSSRTLIGTTTALIMSLAITASLVSTIDAAAATNLLPNPSFEFGVGDITGSPEYQNPQPLLPQGWTFEGNAGLFDHSQGGSHTGQRMAAISIPASGKRQICELGAAGVPCAGNPTQSTKDAARKYHSVNPAWRTLELVDLEAAGPYHYLFGFELSAWVSGELVTQGEGAFMGVRWYKDNAPIGYDQIGPSAVSSEWQELTGTLFPPPGADSAHVLLGHSDDTWIGQVRFDDVCFGIC